MFAESASSELFHSENSCPHPSVPCFRSCRRFAYVIDWLRLDYFDYYRTSLIVHFDGGNKQRPDWGKPVT